MEILHLLEKYFVTQRRESTALGSGANVSVAFIIMITIFIANLFTLRNYKLLNGFKIIVKTVEEHKSKIVTIFSRQ